MDKAELLAIVGGAFMVIAALTGLAYTSVISRIQRNEELREQDMAAVWKAIDEQRADTKKMLAEMVTKDDLRRAEDRLIAALRPAGHAD
jgi:hypothetical protein